MLSYCGQIVKQFDYDRYLCSVFTPHAQREQLFALYAFHYELARIREMVSEPLAGYIRLQWWHEALDTLGKAAPPEHPVLHAFLTHNLPLSTLLPALHTLITTYEETLDDTVPLTSGQFLHALQGSSSTLLTCTLHLGPQDAFPPLLYEGISSMGIAWGILQVIHNIFFHHTLKKPIPLPHSLLEETGIRMEDIIKKYDPSAHAPLIKMLIQLAYPYWEKAHTLFATLPTLPSHLSLTHTLAGYYLHRITHRSYDASLLQNDPPKRLRKLLYLGWKILGIRRHPGSGQEHV